jgi:hypothetical protein
LRHPVLLENVAGSTFLGVSHKTFQKLFSLKGSLHHITLHVSAGVVIIRHLKLLLMQTAELSFS